MLRPGEQHAVAVLMARAMRDPTLHHNELQLLARWQQGDVITHLEYRAATRIDIWRSMSERCAAYGGHQDAVMFRSAVQQATVTDESPVTDQQLNHAATMLFVQQTQQRQVASAIRDLYWAAGELAVWASPIRRSDASSVAQAAWLVLEAYRVDPTLPSSMLPFTADVLTQLLEVVQPLRDVESLDPREKVSLPSKDAATSSDPSAPISRVDPRPAFVAWRAVITDGTATAIAIDHWLQLPSQPSDQPPWDFPLVPAAIVNNLDLAMLAGPHRDAIAEQLRTLPPSQVLPRERQLRLLALLDNAYSATSIEVAIQYCLWLEAQECTWWDVFAQFVFQPLAVGVAFDAGLASDVECASASQRAIVAFGSMAAWQTALALAPFVHLLQSMFDTSTVVLGNHQVMSGVSGAWNALRFPGAAAFRKSQADKQAAGAVVDKNVAQWIARICAVVKEHAEKGGR